MSVTADGNRALQASVVLGTPGRLVRSEHSPRTRPLLVGSCLGAH